MSPEEFAANIIPLGLFNPMKQCKRCEAELLIFHGNATCPECHLRFKKVNGVWQEYDWQPGKTHGGFKMGGAK